MVETGRSARATAVEARTACGLASSSAAGSTAGASSLEVALPIATSRVEFATATTVAARIAVRTGSIPDETGRPIISPSDPATRTCVEPVRAKVGPMVDPLTDVAGPAPTGMAPRTGLLNRTVVRRSGAPDGAASAIQRRSAGPPRAGSAASCGEGVVGQRRRPPGDGIVRERDANVAWRGWTSTNELDQGGAADDAEDETEGQEAELARGHPARVPGFVLLRVGGTIARPM